MQTDMLKTHFDQEAKKYDDDIQKIIPNYNLMIEIMMSIIPFQKNSNFKAIDLGCGTGVLSKTIKDNYPNVEVTCVDLAENMLDIAKHKIGDVKCIQSDFESLEFPENYSLIVSSLAMHHISNDEEKIKFYHKIHDTLEDDGIFINIDPMLGADERLHKIYMDKWTEFMEETFSKEEVESRWLTSHRQNDALATAITHIDMLRKCGFSSIDIVYKYYKYAVYTARK